VTGIVARWAGGGRATCLECGTVYAGMVCPTCGQRPEARDLPGRIAVEVQTEAGDNLLVLAERHPDTGGWDPARTFVASAEAARMLARHQPDPEPVGGLFDTGPEVA
jgi:hypothetical protein